MKKIGVIGAGKLGICFALNAERKGFKVHAVDINEETILAIKNKNLKSHEPLVSKYLRESKHFTVSKNIEDLINDDIQFLFVFVATPSHTDGSYSHTQVNRVLDELKAFGKREREVQLIIGCTVMPEYCNSIEKNLKALNYHLVYNPEFIAQGSIIKNQSEPDQILLGLSSMQTETKIKQFYKEFCSNSPIFNTMDLLSAEITKIAINCFLTTKISFANSIGDLAKTVGADYEKILSSIASDSRISEKYLNYGYGFGGPCFPRDNRALNKYAKDNKYPLRISDATDKVNTEHLEFQYNEFCNKYKPNEQVFFDGVTYKKGSILLDDSQKFALALKLAKKGRKVIITDYKEVIDEIKKSYPNVFILREKKNEWDT